MNCDVCIIGGGAAGLTAALSASDGGAGRVMVLESAPRAGRKILASGNGRCNLANMGEPRYFGDTAFALAVMRRMPAEAVLRFFHGLGLVTVEEAGGRVYPGCGQASAVLDTLREAMARRGVEEACGVRAQKIEPINGGFAITTDRGVTTARRVIVACGGMAGGKLGHDGGPYRLLTALGHRLVSPKPALTQLIAQKEAVRGLSGLRVPALLILCDGEKPVAAAGGEALFTDYGISGVCAMQLSRDAGRILEKGREATLYMDFTPMLGLTPRVYDRLEPASPSRHAPLTLACLNDRRHILPKDQLLLGLAPKLLMQKLRGQDIRQLANSLAAYPVPIIGVKGFENAQVTCGGIACRDFSPETMESSLVPGLYCAGEMLNVDGDCGGYNLQFAFAGGILAGQSAGRASKPEN